MLPIAAQFSAAIFTPPRPEGAIRCHISVAQRLLRQMIRTASQPRPAADFSLRFRCLQPPGERCPLHAAPIRRLCRRSLCSMPPPQRHVAVPRFRLPSQATAAAIKPSAFLFSPDMIRRDGDIAVPLEFR